MSYVVDFHGSNNSLNIWSGWPSRLSPFRSPEWIEETGYALPNGTYYSGVLDSNYINNNKELLGIGENQVYMTQAEFEAYKAEHHHYYTEWQTGILNPENKTKKIKEIKAEAQKRIVEPMGYNVHDVEAWAAKQINLTARFSELQDNLRINGSWTPQEQGEYTALTGLWAKVKAIRNYSNQLETYINSGINVDIYSGWPEV